MRRGALFRVPFHFFWSERTLDGAPVRTVELCGSWLDSWKRRIPLQWDPRMRIWAVDTLVPTRGQQSFKFIINGDQVCCFCSFPQDALLSGGCTLVLRRSVMAPET